MPHGLVHHSLGRDHADSCAVALKRPPSRAEPYRSGLRLSLGSPRGPDARHRHVPVGPDRCTVRPGSPNTARPNPIASAILGPVGIGTSRAPGHFDTSRALPAGRASGNIGDHHTRSNSHERKGSSATG